MVRIEQIAATGTASTPRLCGKLRRMHDPSERSAPRVRTRSGPIPDSYWLIDGLLLAGEYPGSRHRATTRERLASFLDAGIRTFVDLTEETEPLEKYDRVLAELSAERALTTKHIRMCIEDAGVPAGASVMTGILETIRTEIAAGRPVYLHCWGGIGRTGTVIGCWLVESGMAGLDAIDRIAELRENTPDRFARSPETDEQRHYICEWAATGQNGV